MYYLLLENFNNYLNRIYKSFDTVQEYIDYSIDNNNRYVLNATKKTNFNKNDNIRASHIFNDDLSPNYLLWIDETTGAIVSRWFVISYKHISGNQFRAELKRDSIADNFSKIIDSPVFIEKGYVGNGDPAVFNHEEMNFNQIKRAEYPIKQTPVPWIVGYLAKDNSVSGEKTFSYESQADIKISGDIEDWNLYYLCDGTQKRSIISASENNYIEFRLRYSGTAGPWVKCFKFNESQRMNYTDNVENNYYIARNDNLDEIAASSWNDFFNWNTVISLINTRNSFVSESDTEKILEYDNKTIEFDNGIYRINVRLLYGTYGPFIEDNDTVLSNYILGSANNLLNSFNNSIAGSFNKPVSYLVELRVFSVQLTKLESVPGSYKWEFKSQNKALKNAPYKMFAIPLNVSEIPFTIAGINSSEAISPDKDLALAWAMSIIKESGSNLYDIQVLPYIPMENFIITITYRVGQEGIFGYDIAQSSGNTKDIDYIELLGERQDNYSGYNLQVLDVGASSISYTFTYQNDNIIGGSSYSDFVGNVTLGVPGGASLSVSNINYTTGTITFSVSGTKTPDVEATARADFQITIHKEGPVNFAYFFNSSDFVINDLEASEGKNQIAVKNNIVNYKESNETEVYRLTSPNMASSFEFSPSKNGGNRRYYKAFCSYKPYNPFICISPAFLGLYGIDFKDNRGLILAGDFSLDIISDSWTNYKLQNKNYQLAFDRQIENMEITQQVQRMNEIFSSTAGVLKGGLMGGMAGGQVGGPYGAIAGAVVGTASSTIGAVLDYNNNQRLRKESIDYTRDQFGYSLQNIQALPRTLNKVSSLIVTNKFFPFLEYYSCTEQELQALRDKIKYNGMTIMRIGKIIDFLNENDKTYIKAKLIRNTDIACSSDELLDIANELDKGVFI